MSIKRGILKITIVLIPLLAIVIGAYLEPSGTSYPPTPSIFKPVFLWSLIYLFVVSIYATINPKSVWDAEEVLNLTTKSYILAKGIRKESKLNKNYLFHVQLGSIIAALTSLSFALLIITNFSNISLLAIISFSIISIGFAWYTKIKLLEKQWLYIEIICLIIYLILIIVFAVKYGFLIIGSYS